MVPVIELKQNLIGYNDIKAEELRAELREKGIFMVNVMSSPGSGKTTLLLRTLEQMGKIRPDIRAAVLECDIDASVDAETIQAAGTEAVQLHTGGMCHMDAGMTKQGIDALKEKPDIIFIENVGNLVCPAEFDTGAHLNMTILSVPEGDDKPAKYPLMYEVSDIVLINKTDAASVFDFDMEKCRERILKCNPSSKVLPVSAKTGDGTENWTRLLLDIAFGG